MAFDALPPRRLVVRVAPPLAMHGWGFHRVCFSPVPCPESFLFPRVCQPRHGNVSRLRREK